MTHSQPYRVVMPKEGLHTAEDLVHSQPPNKRTELIRGALMVRQPAGYQHGDVAARLAVAIHNHVEAHELGRVLAAETGFILARDPDTVRAASSQTTARIRRDGPRSRRRGVVA
jgi:hypothetical protein